MNGKEFFCDSFVKIWVSEFFTAEETNYPALLVQLIGSKDNSPDEIVGLFLDTDFSS